MQTFGSSLPPVERSHAALSASVRLRPTRHDDLDFVLRLERDGANNPFVGQWSEGKHGAVIETHRRSEGREHWIIEVCDPGLPPKPVGYIVVYDLQGARCGVHLKRIVVDSKCRGIGREAVKQLCRHAFDDLQATFVWLDVLADNHRAQRAYVAAGFERFDSLTPEQRADWAQSVGGFCENDVMMIRRSEGTGSSSTSWPS